MNRFVHSFNALRSASSAVGWTSLRAILGSILITLLLGQAFAGVANLWTNDDALRSRAPSTSPFISMDVRLASVGPVSPVPALTRLMAAMSYLQAKSYVPYVYGGSTIGSPRTCAACSECIKAKHLPADSSGRRLMECNACIGCGIDCSNFVNHVFEVAGMSYRFADTKTLRGVHDMSMEEQYGFVNVGSNLELAKPGDVVLQPNHVILVIAIDQANHTVDYIHASRGSSRTDVGGIERVRQANLFKMQRQVEKILRHRELIEPEDAAIPLAQAWYKDLGKIFARNS